MDSINQMGTAAITALMPALCLAALLRISKYTAGKHQIRFAAMDGS